MDGGDIGPPVHPMIDAHANDHDKRHVSRRRRRRWTSLAAQSLFNETVHVSRING